jgi:hypothetical protein
MKLIACVSALLILVSGCGTIDTTEDISRVHTGYLAFTRVLSRREGALLVLVKESPWAGLGNTFSYKYVTCVGDNEDSELIKNLKPGVTYRITYQSLGINEEGKGVLLRCIKFEDTLAAK